MGESAITPSDTELPLIDRDRRNADAVVEQEDGTSLFVEPHETFEPFQDFLHSIIHSPPESPDSNHHHDVKYAQMQNDNLRNEYQPLFPDVPKDIAFARIALGKEADAINLWLGDDRSVTSLHKDNYENVYVQIRGRKHFVLLPPVEMPCVNERMLSKGRYAPAHDDDESGELTVVPDGQQAEPVPVATWCPDAPAERTTAYSHLAKPLRVTLGQGDMLYLPAMWYHKVSQTVGEEGFVCAVNYWYDMDFAGGFYSNNVFVRDVVNAEGMKPRYPPLYMDGQGQV